MGAKAQKIVVLRLDDDGNIRYWSETEGWGKLEQATRYSNLGLCQSDIPTIVPGQRLSIVEVIPDDQTSG